MADGRGGARSGAGRKPGSKTRATKVAKMTLSELARKHTVRAIEVLAYIMENGENDSSRIAAIGHLLDRGYGRPVQATLELDPDKTPQPFTGFYIDRATAESDQG